MRILGFQIVVFYIAACFLDFSIGNCSNGTIAYGINCIMVGVCLSAFALTIKKANGIPRVLAALALGIQFAVSSSYLVRDLSYSAVQWSLVALDVQTFVAVFLLNGVYFSRIARHAVPLEAAKDGAASDEKSAH